MSILLITVIYFWKQVILIKIENFLKRFDILLNLLIHLFTEIMDIDDALQEQKEILEEIGNLKYVKNFSRQKIVCQQKEKA